MMFDRFVALTTVCTSIAVQLRFVVTLHARRERKKLAKAAGCESGQKRSEPYQSDLIR